MRKTCRWCNLVGMATVFTLALATTVAKTQATPLYFNDFDTVGLPNGPFVTGNTSLTLNTAESSLDYTSTGNGPTVVATATVDVSGHPGFIVSSRFTLTENTGSSSSAAIGFGVLGSATNLGNYYLADWAVTHNSTNNSQGRLRIIGQGSGYGTISAANGNTGGNDSIVTGDTYELRLTGIYTDSTTLDMTFALFDESGVQLGTAATATITNPLSGEDANFGYRNRTGASNQTVSAQYHNFGVTSVPEPASNIMMVLSSIVGGAFYRRQLTRKT